MVQEINPVDTSRADAFRLWINAPMPMVTLFRTLDVTNILRLSRRRGLKFNMLMCWCIGRAASRMEEFYLLPVEGRLMKYDSLAVNTIVSNCRGEVSSCDIPFDDCLATFNSSYMGLTRHVAYTCKNNDITDRMVIGTSAMVKHRIDGAVGMYSGIFNNPFLIWGAYRKRWLRTRLVISFQFHHTQMDGEHAAILLDLLQSELDEISQ